MADETKQLNNRKNATHVVPFAVLIAPTLLNVSTDNNAKANGISMKNCTHTVKREQGTKQKRILRTTLLRAILSSTTSEWNQNETNYISDNNNDRSMLNGKISTEKPILLISRINHSKRHIPIPALWKLLLLFYPENVSIASKYNWRRKMLSFCYWALSQPKACYSYANRLKFDWFCSQHIRLDRKRRHNDTFSDLLPYRSPHLTLPVCIIFVWMFSFRRAFASNHHRFMFGPFKKRNIPSSAQCAQNSSNENVQTHALKNVQWNAQSTVFFFHPALYHFECRTEKEERAGQRDTAWGENG